MNIAGHGTSKSDSYVTLNIAGRRISKSDKLDSYVTMNIAGHGTSKSDSYVTMNITGLVSQINQIVMLQ